MYNTIIEGITSRTLSKSKNLSKLFGIKKVFKSIEDLIENRNIDAAMIFVSADHIFQVSKKLIPYKKPLFIEKPPGLNPYQTKELVELNEEYQTNTMVGFNRRYYSIFQKGVNLIKKNGGLLGLSIEGHERFWNIENRPIKSEIKDTWIYGNSTHTIDLLSSFGGEINEISSFSKSFKKSMEINLWRP